MNIGTEYTRHTFNSFLNDEHFGDMDLDGG